MLSVLLHLAAASLAEPSAWELNLRPADPGYKHAARLVLASARVCRAALLGERIDSLVDLDDRSRHIAQDCLRCRGTPLVLRHTDDFTCRLAPLGFYLSRLAYAPTFARLQGAWCGGSYYVGLRRGSRKWETGALPPQTTTIDGRVLTVHYSGHLYSTHLIEVWRWGGVEVIAPASVDPANRFNLSLFRMAYKRNPWQDYRLTVPVAGVRLVATMWPQGVSLGVWRRQAGPAR